MDSIGIIIYILTLFHGSSAEYGDRIKNATVTWGDNLDMEESRHSAYAVAAPPIHHTEIPITFKAPYINARDYWSDPARRTVLDYQPYAPQDIFTRPINDGINTFYGIMNQFFGTDEPPRRSPMHPPPYRQQPYEYEFPHYRPPPAKPYYLPGPKPLRATVQKLEQTRPPNYSDPNQKNYPTFVKILNDVLIENAHKHQEPVLEKPNYGYDLIVPTTYKPNYRYKFRTSTPQSFPLSIQDQLPPVKHGQDTRIPYITETTTHKSTQASAGTRVVFPVQTESVPPLDYSIDVRNSQNPVTKRPVPAPLPLTPNPPTTNDNQQTTLSSILEFEITTNGDSGIQTTKDPVQKLEIETIITTYLPNTTTNSDSEPEVVTILPSKTPETKEKEESIVVTENAIPTATAETPSETSEKEVSIAVTAVPTVPAVTTAEAITTESTRKHTLQTQPSDIRPVLTELINTMEPLEHGRFRAPFPKTLHSRKATTDPTQSDYVTDLTLKGLTGMHAIHASVRFPNALNMSSVIGYVIGKLNATMPPPNSVVLDDFQSLDAKILKDTNWDGFQPPIPTTDQSYETTTVFETNPSTAQSIPEATTIPTTLPTTIIWSTVPTTTILPTTTEAPIKTTFPPRTSNIISSPVQKQTAVIATRVTHTFSRSSRPRYRDRITTTKEPPQKTEAPIEFDVENVKFTTEIPTTQRSRKRYQSKTTTEENLTTTEAQLENDENLPEPSKTRSFQGYRTTPTTDEPTPRQVEQPINSEESHESTTELPITQTPQSPRRSRKYERRPRIQNFTQFPALKTTEAPVKLGTLSRPFYPKRSRPNVTLTFGNRASKRVDSVERRPTRLSSEAEIQARRSLYSRRNYPSPLRRTTTVSSSNEDT